MGCCCQCRKSKKMLDHNLTSPRQQPNERVETGPEMVDAFLHDSAIFIHILTEEGSCRWDNFSPPTSPSLFEVIVNEELSLSHSTFERSSSVCGWLWVGFSMEFLGFLVLQVSFRKCFNSIYVCFFLYFKIFIFNYSKYRFRHFKWNCV